MQIVPFTTDHLEEAAEHFIHKYKRLRQSIPILPDVMEEKSQITTRLERMVKDQHGIAVIEKDRLVGFLVWYIVADFRSTGRNGAYCPEWGHTAEAGRSAEIYLAMYRHAAQIWAEAECKTHALTYLADDRTLADFLYWNGFGMTAVDAIRPIQFEAKSANALTLRKAQIKDAEIVAMLDEEHWRHYSRPPIFMAQQQPNSVANIREFISEPQNNYWLAEAEGIPAGFLRFEGIQAGAAKIVRSDTTIAISGAFTRPQYRGRGAATALLKAALDDYVSQGYERCSVDFESLNPEASAYWLKHFEPVCYSAIRYPEIYL
jgi:ribosomal protein S18 acetylase RimI-like enzyme